jgi:hypothetical protein
VGISLGLAVGDKDAFGVGLSGEYVGAPVGANDGDALGK